MAELFIEKVKKILDWPIESIDRGKERFEKLFLADQGPDYLPLVFGG